MKSSIIKNLSFPAAHPPRCFIIALILVFLTTTTTTLASQSKILRYSIYEELPISTVVGDVKKDFNVTSKWPSDEQIKLRYYLRHAHKHFTIGEKDGKIFTNHVLDREDLCPDASGPCEQSFDVVIKPSHPAQVVKVVVVVMDINDHNPTFPKDHFDLNIPELAAIGSKYLIPSAEDLDAGQNAIQEYRFISESELFQLVVTNHADNKKEVKIKLNGKLDREEQDKYSVVVVAVDGGEPPLSGSLSVTIKVTDANDNSPKFDQPAYFITVPENIPPTSTLLSVHATDPDLGINGKVVYSFSDHTEKAFGHLFGIDQSTGEIFTKNNLNFELTQTYSLTVQANDEGAGSLPQFVKVTVNVTDVNDNQPEIIVNIMAESGVASVQENVEPGFFVAHITVKDSDSGENKNVSCSIDNDSLFKLGTLFEDQYTISTLATFDREATSSYQVLITCRDHGQPPLTSYKEIDIDITDVNDNAPVFSSSSNFDLSVYENNAPHVLITKINATDVDFGRNAVLQYFLQALNKSHTNVLKIDHILGKVTANIVFDYEREMEYKFLINVSDRGVPSFSSTATLTLHILDLNDEDPKFEKPSYYLYVPENNPIGSVVGSVSATDADMSPAFKKISYRILSSDDAFEINETTGEIKNLKRLDREEQAQYRFQVVASNPGMLPPAESRVNVTVYVDDVNDNPPVFIFPNGESGNLIQISTNSNPGTLVTRLVAKDIDVGPNAELVFSITNGNVDNSFAIDPTTGVITVAKPLKEKGTQDRLHRLVISVSDLGNPPFMAVADLNIFINSTIGIDDTSMALSNKLSEKNIIVLAGVCGAVILVVLCIVIIVISLRKRGRRRQNERGKYMVTKVLDAYETESNQNRHCRSGCTQSNEASSSTVDCRKLGSSSVTVDTSSTKSESGGCNCNRGPGPNMTVARDDEDDDLEMCRLHDPSVMMMATSWDPTQNMRITPSNVPAPGDPHAGRCSSATCRGFGASPSYYHRHHYCNCCNSHVSCYSPPGQQCHHYTNTPHPQQPPYVVRNKRSLYSPESIPLQPVARVGHHREQDLESVCSGSTWTDSGRGPSEEDDHVKNARIESFLRTTLAK